MSEYTHRGTHPDADLLSAFAEGALPEHERLACVDHLAGCSQCREIVFLAQPDIADEPVPVPAAEPSSVPFWKRWVVPISVLSAVAAAAVLVVSITATRDRETARVPAPELMAKVEAPPQAEEVQTESPPARESISQPSAKAPPSKPGAASTLDAVATPTPVPPPPPPAAVAPIAVSAPVAVSAPPSAAPRPTPGARAINPLSAPAAFMPAAIPPYREPAGVTGKVTDPAGGAVARAQVNLTDANNKTTTSTTDNGGQFSLAGIQPGHYQLKIQAAGFKSAVNEIDVQPQQIARADSKLELGSVSDTVTVMAEAAPARAAGGGGRGGANATPLPARSGGLGQGAFSAGLATETAARGNLAMDGVAVSESVARTISLPSKLPAVSTVTSGKITLSADSNGALFLNSGKSWKTVKGKWKGKVVRLVIPPDVPNANGAVFQLNTDSSEVWLSKDGNRWDAAKH